MGRTVNTCPGADLHFANEMIFGKSGLRFCGCGLPEDALDVVRSVLEHFADKDRDWRIEWGADLPDGVQVLVLYTVDGAGLLEHGGSVYGSWLTPAGERFLAVLQRRTWDQIEDAGIACGDATCETPNMGVGPRESWG